MAIRLADILKPLDTDIVEIRGVSIPLRALLGDETMELERQDPEPLVTKDNAGTEALALDQKQYVARRKAAVFGLSAGISNAAGEEWTPQRDRKWVHAWTAGIIRSLTEYELQKAYSAASTVGIVLPKTLEQTGERVGTAEKPGN